MSRIGFRQIYSALRLQWPTALRSPFNLALGYAKMLQEEEEEEEGGFVL